MLEGMHVSYSELSSADGKVDLWIHGLDLGPHTFRIAQHGVYAVWHKPAHKFFSGIALPQSVDPATYFLVQDVAPGRAVILKEIQPGSHWKRERDRLIEKARDLERNYGNGLDLGAVGMPLVAPAAGQ